jgi:hypothetical protein
MSNAENSPQKTILTMAGGSGTVSVGDLIYGTTSGVTGIVTLVSGSNYYVDITSGSYTLLIGETVNDDTSGATKVLSAQKDQYSMYLHEKGKDHVSGDDVTAIYSMFETADFGLPTGGAQPNQGQGVNRWTRCIRVEPDFLQEGEMSMYVTGKEFANAPETVSSGYNFTSETERIDMREQRREIRLKFESNVVGGHYEMGRVILHIQPGDVRN